MVNAAGEGGALRGRWATAIETAAVGTGVVVADQWTKALAVWVSPYSHGTIQPVWNPGSTVDVASSTGVEGAVLALVVFAAAFIVICGMKAGRTVLGAVPPWIVGLLVGGAASNLLDRVLYGAVRDFLATPWIIVNVADLALAAGLLGVMLAHRSSR